MDITKKANFSDVVDEAVERAEQQSKNVSGTTYEDVEKGKTPFNPFALEGRPLEVLPENQEALKRLAPYLRDVPEVVCQEHQFTDVHGGTHTFLGDPKVSRTVLRGKTRLVKENLGQICSRLHLSLCWIVGPLAWDDETMEREIRKRENLFAGEQREAAAFYTR